MLFWILTISIRSRPSFPYYNAKLPLKHFISYFIHFKNFLTFSHIIRFVLCKQIGTRPCLQKESSSQLFLLWRQSMYFTSLLINSTPLEKEKGEKCKGMKIFSEKRPTLRIDFFLHLLRRKRGKNWHGLRKNDHECLSV